MREHPSASSRWTDDPWFITPEPAPDQSFKSVKVSKFIATLAYMHTHLCQAGALACCRTPAWCRPSPDYRCSLPCPCLPASTLDKQILNYLTVGQKNLSKKLMCPPPPSHTSTRAPPLPQFKLIAPPSNRAAPWPSVMGTYWCQIGNQ